MNNRMLKKGTIFISLILILTFIFSVSASVPIGGDEDGKDISDTDTGANGDIGTDASPVTLECKSAILMEAQSGAILYAQNENEPLPPASVTKVMTMLLCMEEIDSGRLSLTDTVTASAYATSMGGSQIYLKEGEQMSVEDMLKSVVIASANDAAVALAEHICGSEEAFVLRMNERARELGMKNTNFENTNGLDDTAQDHKTSALDIALMSRELMKHKKIFEYSSTWMDTIRNGEFGLTNTNRLIRYYKGATGLKTGSTSKAGFCISATAERDGVQLIAVIMGAESRDIRNECAKKLFDYGFASYSIYTAPTFEAPPIPVTGGRESSVSVYADGFFALVKKGGEKNVKAEAVLPEGLNAPIKSGDTVGEIIYSLDGKEIGRSKIYAASDVEKISFTEVLRRMLSQFLLSPS